MLSRQLLLLTTVKFAESKSRNFSHKFNRKILNTILNNQVLKYVPKRHTSTSKSYLSKAVPILAGTAIVGGAIGAYSYFSKSNTSHVEEHEDVSDDPPYVYEHLEEDLALLKEYGKIPYLLIGAGSASYHAYRAIRIADPTSKILIIGEEPYHPYMRTPLSKEMWFDPHHENASTLSFTNWQGTNRSILYEQPEYYFPLKEILENKNGGVSVIRGCKAIKIDPVSQIVYLKDGGEIAYEKCLIATGSKPKNIPLFENANDSIKKHISLFKTAQDFHKLDKILKKSDSVVIVGGGFLGSELAVGIAKRRGLEKFQVIQIFPESGNLGKHIPEYLSKWTSNKLKEDGVKIIPNASVKSVFEEGNKLKLELSNGETIKTDHVVVAVGSEADTEIAKSSGLEVDEKNSGFIVNAEMEARKNLWVAGDASCFYDILLGRRRVEHHGHAIVSGELAGQNMTGSGVPYTYQSSFWSDLGPGIGMEAVGIIDSSLPTVGIFVKEPTPNLSDIVKKELDSPDTESTKSSNVEDKSQNSNDNYEKGVIFYLKNDIIVGILTWNILFQMSIAKRVLSESKSYDDLTDVARLFDLNSDEL